MAAAKGAELETTTKTPELGRLFVVRQSYVKSGGAVRINGAVRAELGIEPKAMVEVVFGKKSVAVHLYADDQVAPDQIVLRSDDMHRLGVTEGEQVRVKPYPRAFAGVRDSFLGVGRHVESRPAASPPREPGGT